MGRLFPYGGKAYVIGVTGPPGVGKSTLVDGLIGRLRDRGGSVAVLAVDPTSPFTGGALLGDRVRMSAHAADRGVFVRSFATRGYLGGLCRAVGDALRVVDAAGFDYIIVETVGTGQAEVDVMRYAPTVVVVLVPGLGDDVQMIKAGLLEVAHVLVVNKADREGAQRMIAQLRALLELSPPSGWTPPIVATVATRGTGVDELVEKIDLHREYMMREGRWEASRRRLLIWELEELVRRQAASAVLREAREGPLWERVCRELFSRRLAPHQAARKLWEDFLARTVRGDGGEGVPD